LDFLSLSHLAVASAQELRFDLPQPEHRLLERLVGDWRFERQNVPPEGSDPQNLGTGVISSEMVGDFFIVSRWSGTVYGADYEALQSLGYDIEQKKYTGSWIDSFISFRWEFGGTIDEESQELTLTTNGPAPAGGTATFRERYRFESADSITIFGEMQRGERWVTSRRPGSLANADDDEALHLGCPRGGRAGGAREAVKDADETGELTHDVMESHYMRVRAYGPTAVVPARGVSGGRYGGEPFHLVEQVDRC
jgi:hypothetical protein